MNSTPHSSVGPYQAPSAVVRVLRAVRSPGRRSGTLRVNCAKVGRSLKRMVPSLAVRSGAPISVDTCPPLIDTSGSGD
jgi:hypothetical protein